VRQPNEDSSTATATAAAATKTSASELKIMTRSSSENNFHNKKNDPILLGPRPARLDGSRHQHHYSAAAAHGFRGRGWRGRGNRGRGRGDDAGRGYNRSWKRSSDGDAEASKQEEEEKMGGVGSQFEDAVEVEAFDSSFVQNSALKTTDVVTPFQQQTGHFSNDGIQITSLKQESAQGNDQFDDALEDEAWGIPNQALRPDAESKNEMIKATIIDRTVAIAQPESQQTHVQRKMISKGPNKLVLATKQKTVTPRLSSTLGKGREGYHLKRSLSPSPYNSNAAAKRIKIPATIQNEEECSAAAVEVKQEQNGNSTNAKGTESTNVTPSASASNNATKETLTDFAYRETTSSSSYPRGRGRGGRNVSNTVNMGLVRVNPDTKICPTFLRGIKCDDEHCRKRHDVPVESARPVCSFFQRHGQCLKGSDCPFRHVKVRAY